MISLTFDGLKHEWIIRFHLDEICTQTIRTADTWLMKKYVQDFAILEKGLSDGKKYYTVPQ